MKLSCNGYFDCIYLFCVINPLIADKADSLSALHVWSKSRVLIPWCCIRSMKVHTPILSLLQGTWRCDICNTHSGKGYGKMLYPWLFAHFPSRLLTEYECWFVCAYSVIPLFAKLNIFVHFLCFTEDNQQYYFLRKPLSIKSANKSILWSC